MIRSILIPAAKVDSQGQTFVVYTLVVKATDGLTWSIRKRFNQLLAFRSEIKEFMKESKVPFPSKISLLGFAQDRRKQLEEYMDEVLAWSKTKKELQNALNGFLEYREHIDAYVLATFTPKIAQRHLLTLMDDDFEDSSDLSEEQRIQQASNDRQLLQPTTEVE